MLSKLLRNLWNLLGIKDPSDGLSASIETILLSRLPEIENTNTIGCEVIMMDDQNPEDATKMTILIAKGFDTDVENVWPKYRVDL